MLLRASRDHNKRGPMSTIWFLKAKVSPPNQIATLAFASRNALIDGSRKDQPKSTVQCPNIRACPPKPSVIGRPCLPSGVHPFIQQIINQTARSASRRRRSECLIDGRPTQCVIERDCINHFELGRRSERGRVEAIGDRRRDLTRVPRETSRPLSHLNVRDLIFVMSGGQSDLGPIVKLRNCSRRRVSLGSFSGSTPRHRPRNSSGPLRLFEQRMHRVDSAETASNVDVE
jgi:hypothetical protein